MPRLPKSKRQGFKPGHLPHNKMRKCLQVPTISVTTSKTLRLTKTMQKKVDSAKCRGVVAGQEIVGPGHRLLRPKDGAPSKTEEYASNSTNERYLISLSHSQSIVAMFPAD